MTTAYSTNLELALPVQGELSGTWGDTVNNGITQYLDTAIAGSQIISGSQTAVTLSNTNGDASATNIAQVGSGSTGTAQYQIIRCTGNPAGLLTITVSDTTTVGYSKTFVIINATSTSQSVKIVGSGPTTGVTILSGAKSLVAWNGSDFVEIASSTADGVTTFSAGTTGFTPSTATSGAVTLAGTLATTNGGTGLTSFTANGVVYASSTSALATGSALTFDGTTVSSPIVQSTNGTITTVLSYSGGNSTGVIGTTSNHSVEFRQNNTEGMRLTSTGLGIGTSSPAATLQVGATGVGSASGSNSIAKFRIQKPVDTTSSPWGTRMIDLYAYYPGYENSNPSSTIYSGVEASSSTQNGYFAIQTLLSNVLYERARIDSAGYLSGVWADKVTALGNSGTATTITCTSGNVFTATLTGNCTFTLSAPSTTTANTATSFTLILTNDGTAGRTVAFSGGTFKSPGGSVTRTTTANATDIWFFFSPDGGTTWYYSIPMANLS